MLVDMHIHTAVSSPCSRIQPRDLLVVARKIGLDGICVTEHEEWEGAEAAWRLGKEAGFPVFRGVEVYTEFGDMLVFGLRKERFPFQVGFRELLREVREAGGIIIPCHPCRGGKSLHDLLGKKNADFLLANVDAVEIRNGGSTVEANRAAEETASRYGLPGVGGSDAHLLFQVGRCLTVFERRLEDEEDLVREVREGRCRAAYAEEVEGVDLTSAWA
jgi:hypothetical protein